MAVHLFHAEWFSAGNHPADDEWYLQLRLAKAGLVAGIEGSGMAFKIKLRMGSANRVGIVMMQSAAYTSILIAVSCVTSL